MAMELSSVDEEEKYLKLIKKDLLSSNHTHGMWWLTFLYSHGKLYYREVEPHCSSVLIQHSLYLRFEFVFAKIDSNNFKSL